MSEKRVEDVLRDRWFHRLERYENRERAYRGNNDRLADRYTDLCDQIVWALQELTVAKRIVSRHNNRLRKAGGR